MIYIVRDTSNSRRLPALLFLAFVLSFGLAAAPALFAAQPDPGAGLPEPHEIPSCVISLPALGGDGGEGGLVEEILDDGLAWLAVDGEDLLVEIGWASDPTLPDADLWVDAPDGTSWGPWPVTRHPGEVDLVTLSGVLSGVGTHGFQFRLRLEDATSVRAELDFHVGVECPTPGVCRFTVTGGLDGPAVVSEAFWNALQAALASGSGDLLATLTASSPGVAHEIPGFLWQTSMPTSPDDGCHCEWLAISDSVPTIGIDGDGRLGTGNTHRAGATDTGAAFEVSAQSVGGTATWTATDLAGRSVLGLQLLCVEGNGSRLVEYPTEWGSRPFLGLDRPILSACPAPCTPEIEHRARVEGCVETWTQSRDGHAATGTASAFATLDLGALRLVEEDAALDVGLLAGERVADGQAFLGSAEVHLSAMGAMAVLETGGELVATAGHDPLGGTDSYAFVGADLDYDLQLRGEASCHGIPFVDVRRHTTRGGGQHEGGVVAIVRWEP